MPFFAAPSFQDGSGSACWANPGAVKNSSGNTTSVIRGRGVNIVISLLLAVESAGTPPTWGPSRSGSRRATCRCAVCSLAPLMSAQNPGDGLNEIVPGKRLGEVASGSPQTFRLTSSGRFIARGDEDDRYRLPGEDQSSVQFKPGDARKLNVEYQAVGRLRRAGFEGRFGGRERDWRETPEPQNPLDRLAHAGVVFDEDDCWQFAGHRSSPHSR